MRRYITGLALLHLATGVAISPLVGCGSQAPKPVAAPSITAPAPASGPAAAPLDVPAPVAERASGLREAAALLEKAGVAHQKGSRNLAEQLFSTAELITGPEAVAALAPTFRAGAPERITTPTKKVALDAAPQPKLDGNSEADDVAEKAPAPKALASLRGQVQINGQPAKALGLVTLEPLGRKGTPRKPKRRVLEQRGREFLPRLLAVPVGSTVEFPNFDQVFHNVFSSSPAAAFDLGLYRSGEAREVRFDKEGIVRLGCNLHSNMSGYIAIVAAPHFVVVDESGAFSFGRLAPGKYTLKAWSERSSQPLTMEVTLKAGENQLNVGVAGDAPAGPSPDKFGAKRG